jgi:hypothetical protein
VVDAPGTRGGEAGVPCLGCLLVGGAVFLLFGVPSPIRRHIAYSPPTLNPTVAARRMAHGAPWCWFEGLKTQVQDLFDPPELPVVSAQNCVGPGTRPSKSRTPGSLMYYCAKYDPPRCGTPRPAGAGALVGHWPVFSDQMAVVLLPPAPLIDPGPQQPPMRALVQGLGLSRSKLSGSWGVQPRCPPSARVVCGVLNTR